MKTFLTRAARAGSLAALAVSLGACGPEDTARMGALPHFGLPGGGPLGFSLLDSPTVAPAYDAPYPEALPLQPAVADFGLAPSWDYASNGYADHASVDPYEYRGYDDGYYAPGEAGYYDSSVGSDDYAWVALAALIAGVLGDSPPDYGFDYDGVQPWAWRTGDGYARYAEPIHGGNRYYYYAPNATRPFLVRDPYYSYGYRDDRLVAIYDRDGRVLSERAALRHRLAAQRYYERARQLHRASLAERRHGVSAPVWVQHRSSVAADWRRWQEAREHRAAWREWNQRNEQDLRRRWERERELRQRAVQRFDGWRAASYRGPAPRFYEVQRREQAEQRQRERAAAERQEQRREAEARAERKARELLQQRREALADRRERAEERQEEIRREAAQREAVDRRRQAAVRQERQVEARREAARAEQREQAEARERAQRQQALAERRETERRQQARAAEQRQRAARQAQARAAEQAGRERATRQRAAAEAREDAQRRQAQAAREAQQAQRRQVQEAARERAAEQARGEARQRARAEARREAQAARAQAQEQRRAAQARSQERPRAVSAAAERASATAQRENRGQAQRARQRNLRAEVRAER